MRSPLLAAIPAALAAGACAARWALQGSGNLYTAPARRAYVPDPDLGWRVVDDGPPWLGLDAVGGLLGLTALVLLGAWWLHRRERRVGPHPALRVALWVPAVAALAVPAWAFAGGLGAAGARDTLPTGLTAAPGDGITGGLEAPAGRWEVVAHAGTSLTARLSAGGEAFDARFARGVTGAWTGDPRDLRQPMTVEVVAEVAEVDTGIPLRSKSARQDYLRAGEFPVIRFQLERLRGASLGPDGRLAFAADGRITLMDQPVTAPVAGSLRLLDDAARARLGLPDAPAMIAEADLRLAIRDTPLAPDAGDFDAPEIPIHVSLVLVHRPTSPQESDR